VRRSSFSVLGLRAVDFAYPTLIELEKPTLVPLARAIDSRARARAAITSRSLPSRYLALPKEKSSISDQVVDRTYNQVTRFPEFCGHPGLQPSPKQFWGLNDDICHWRRRPHDLRVGLGGSRLLSLLPLDGADHHCQEARREQLLALRALRRSLESRASTDRPTTVDAMNDAGLSERPDRAQTIRALRELIAALDRRVPQVNRSGEVAIAESAALLRAQALKRIEDLEQSPAPRGVASPEQSGEQPVPHGFALLSRQRGTHE
jgi:hypothetical protein